MTSTSDILKNSSKLLTRITRAYERRLSQYGNDPRGVFWQNKEYQFKRFEILSHIFDPADYKKNISIHDFGCGYGALFEYLIGKPIMENAQYIGTDMSSQMITAARKKVTDQRAEFRRNLIAIDAADYTLVSGTFNMHLGQDEEEWEAYIKASLLQLWSKTRVGLAFNMLRDDAEYHYDGLFYINGHDLFDFCATRLSPNVEIQNDSPLPDWTIFVRK
jgi:cyclopropane fatty-acyl-phospholipid synthase-like methyltransferase